MRGQGRELAEVGAQLQEAEAAQEALRGQVADLQARLEAKGREAELASEQATELRQELDEATIQHEGERLELMNGLDQKDGELLQLNERLQAQQEAQTRLEAERDELQAQVQEQRVRLAQLDRLMQDASDRLRKGSDIARGVGQG